ncbi:MAG: hypothetical protein Q9183_006701, partial [Haloplaca sp. 2 TL-2023]
MRLSASLTWATCLSALQAVASPAYIYVTGSTDKATPQTLSPVNARLLLARRLGLSKYHSLENAEDSTLKILNDYGGEQRTLLSEEEQWSGDRRNLVVVDDVEDLDGEYTQHSLQVGPYTESAPALVASIKSKPVFTMPQSPQASDNLQFMKDLDKQAESLEPSGQDLCRETFSAKGFKSGAMISDMRVNRPLPNLNKPTLLIILKQEYGKCISDFRNMADYDTLSYWINVLSAFSIDRPGRTSLVYISWPELLEKDSQTPLFTDGLSHLLNPA